MSFTLCNIPVAFKLTVKKMLLAKLSFYLTCFVVVVFVFSIDKNPIFSLPKRRFFVHRPFGNSYDELDFDTILKIL
ncbi:hypothetical protein MAR_018867 [Mya arenaria]|uniref:Uncharacterized protein n=1 Tax=Mya arenaria TaxID=6604 RepID=A0ABY7EIE1_MYAAR|nr:hypothetical protein MAR_018867 [Mya arenaria]